MEESRYIAFDKYINKELSGIELKAFEKKLRSDEDLKNEFEIYKALETTLSSKYENEESEKELRNTLSNLGAEFIKKEEAPVKKDIKVISIRRYGKLMVAASIALLIGFFLFNNGTPVYSDFSDHYSLELTVRSENNDNIIKAEQAFNSKKYNQALNYLKQLSLAYPGDSEIELYVGICLLELDKFKEAESIFDNISSGNSSFSDTATWYKALVFLKQEKYEACKELLKTIPEDAEKYEAAKKLLKKL